MGSHVLTVKYYMKCLQKNLERFDKRNQGFQCITFKKLLRELQGALVIIDWDTDIVHTLREHAQ